MWSCVLSVLLRHRGDLTGVHFVALVEDAAGAERRWRRAARRRGRRYWRPLAILAPSRLLLGQLHLLVRLLLFRGGSRGVVRIEAAVSVLLHLSASRARRARRASHSGINVAVNVRFLRVALVLVHGALLLRGPGLLGHVRHDGLLGLRAAAVVHGAAGVPLLPGITAGAGVSAVAVLGGGVGVEGDGRHAPRSTAVVSRPLGVVTEGVGGAGDPRVAALLHRAVVRGR